MKPSKKMIAFVCSILALTLLLTACRSAIPVNFYTLNDQTPPVPPEKERFNLSSLSVGIGSVNLPEYLDRPQIVTLKGPHQLHLSEFDRWAGHLEGEVGRLMGKNLSMILGTTKIVTFPWDQSERPDYRVDITFYHLEGTLGQTVRLQGGWSLTDKNDTEHALHYQFNQEVEISGPDYEDFVAACSRGLWDLSRKIGREIAAAVENSAVD